MKKIFKGTFLVAVGMAVVTTMAPQVEAREAVLRAVSGFPKGSFFSRRLEGFIAEVNKTGKGTVSIQYLGGAPEIGSPLEVVRKMTRGIYDIVSITGAYYQNVLPEADAWKLTEVPPTVLRKNGGWDYMQKLHAAKNMYVLARLHYGTQFHLYLSADKKIDKPSLKGVHLRVAPIYRNFFQSLGATTQFSTLAEVYTLMENKTVNGYGWPVTGLQPGWEKVTGYRVDPGFYDADIELLVNLRTWKRLDKKAQAVLNAAALKFEVQGMEQDVKAVAVWRKKQDGWGIKVIEFTGADKEAWLKAARDAGWAGVNKVSPKTGPELRKYFVK